MTSEDSLNRVVNVHPLGGLILVLILVPVLSGCWGSPSKNISSTYDLKAIAIDPVTPTTLYVGTDGGGVFKSTDGGSSWAPINNGLIDLKVTALAIDWVTPSRIYAGTENGGIFASLDYGETWSSPIGQSAITSIRAIVIDRNFCPPTPPCRGVYLASQSSGVWRSADGGFTFSPFTDNLSNSAVTAMAIYPTLVPDQATSRLYIGTEGGGFFSRGVNPSIDAQWTEAIPGLKALTQEEVVSMAVNPQLASELYVGTSGGEAGSGGSGIYKSTDSGITFNLSYDPKFKFTIYFVAPLIGPTTADLTLYAGSDGIVRSVDRGGFWCILWDCSTPSEILQPGLTAFAAADFMKTDIDHTTFYAALFNRKIIKTTDGGQTWTTLGLQ
ncbi:MAG TPA: hypothetical protein VLY20_06985 [Nitrospiria bacterium]|nr:hypothetical protein [Nitrospiria bacterium]